MNYIKTFENFELFDPKGTTTITNEEVDKLPWITFVANNNNLSIEEVSKRFLNVEFIPLYRAEGKTIDREKLHKFTKNSAGRWFTPTKSSAERYLTYGTNKNLYVVYVPKEYYDSAKYQYGAVEDEVLLPIEVALMKKVVKSNATNIIDKF